MVNFVPSVTQRDMYELREHGKLSLATCEHTRLRSLLSLLWELE